MDELNDIFKSTFKITDDEVGKDLTMNDVSQWDSLTHMDMITAIEEKFEIQLTGDEIAEMITFDAIRKVMSKYIQ